MPVITPGFLLACWRVLGPLSTSPASVSDPRRSGSKGIVELTRRIWKYRSSRLMAPNRHIWFSVRPVLSRYRVGSYW